MLGALIIVKFKGAAITACGDDTNATSFIEEIFDSTKAGMVILALTIIRITSYNVCYTKLLRYLINRMKYILF